MGLVVYLSTRESLGILLGRRLSNAGVHFCEPRAPLLLSFLLHVHKTVLISFNLLRPTFSFCPLYSLRPPPLFNSSLWRELLLNPSLSTSPLLNRISKSVLKCKLLDSSRGKVKTMEIKRSENPSGVPRSYSCVFKRCG